MKHAAIMLTVALVVLAAHTAHARTSTNVEEVDVYGDRSAYTSSTSSSGSHAAQESSRSVGNFAFRIGPVGNIFTVDSNTMLDPGFGGYIAFDYRFHPNFSAEIGVMMSIQDGDGVSSGDNNIILIGAPTFDLKYYFMTDSRWDPFAILGFGLYTLTEGSRNNGSMAFGVGSNLGIGCDYYLTERISIGLTATFRAIALIESIDGPNNASAQFPFGMAGNFAYHF